MVMTETMRPITAESLRPEAHRDEEAASQPSSATGGPSVRPVAAGAAPSAGPSSGPTRAAATLPPPAAFRLGDTAEDRLIGQVAFALAAEAGPGSAQSREAIEALRAQASTALSDFAFRYLHNRAEEIRREAAREATAAARKPPGFLTLVLANLIALALAGAAGVALAMNPHLLAGLSGH